MRVKLIKDWTDEKGRTDKAGTHIDIAYRYAKALIKQGLAIPDTEQVENITSYSKDNPPPEVQEVELEKEFFEPAPVKPKKVTWWDKIKSLWHRLA